MTADTILQMIIALIPTIIVAGIAYYLFKGHIDNENNRRRFLIQQSITKNTLPLRLQAYERMALFVERISPAKLVTRIPPNNTDKNAYEMVLIATIEQEYEHNLSQQIYVTDECWNVITTAKNTTIQMIRKANMLQSTDSANRLQEVILNELLDKHPPSNAALTYIKNEVKDILR